METKLESEKCSIFLSKKNSKNDGRDSRFLDRSIDRSNPTLRCIARLTPEHRYPSSVNFLPFGDDGREKHPSSSSLLFGWRTEIFCQTLLENTGHAKLRAKTGLTTPETRSSQRVIYILASRSKISSYFYASTGTIRERSIVSRDRNKYRNSLAGGGIIIDP